MAAVPAGSEGAAYAAAPRSARSSLLRREPLPPQEERQDRAPKLASVVWRVVQNLRPRSLAQPITQEDVELRPVDAISPQFVSDLHQRRQTLTKLPRTPILDSTRRDVDLSSKKRVRDSRDGNFTVTLMEYDEHSWTVTSAASHEQLQAILDRISDGKEGPVRWIHIEPLFEDVLRKVEKALQLNATATTYSLHHPQRATFEAYDKCVFVLMQAPSLKDQADALSGLEMLQLSVFLCENNVLVSTCLENSGNLLEPIRSRLRLSASALRQGNSCFLLNSLVNQVLLSMKGPADPFGDMLSDLEQEILTRADSDKVRKVHALRRELGLLRHEVWPMRELLAALQQSASPLLSESTRKYFNSSYDQTIQLIDLLETYRELATSLLELFASRTSKQLGRIIRTVTMLQVLFLPAIFLAAVYGMNFKEGMWELEWEHGYQMFWGLVSGLTVIELIIFRVVGWL